MELIGAAIIPNDRGLSIEGSATFHNVVALRQLGEQALRTHFLKNKLAVIHFSNFKDHNASSFSLLLCWMRLAKQNDARLQFNDLPDSMRRMEKMFGLTGVCNG